LASEVSSKGHISEAYSDKETLETFFDEKMMSTPRTAIKLFNKELSAASEFLQTFYSVKYYRSKLFGGVR
jgi:hypothetical protein